MKPDQNISNSANTPQPEMNSTPTPNAVPNESKPLSKTLFQELKQAHPWLHEFNISTKEQSALPEFFDPNNIYKNQYIYQELRNFIIKAYWLKPERRLLFTSIRRSVQGDVGCLLRLFKFLEKEGVINKNIQKKVEVKKYQKRSFMEAFEFPVRRFGDLEEELEGGGKLKRIKNKIHRFLLESTREKLPECCVCEEQVSLRWLSHTNPKGEFKQTRKLSICVSIVFSRKDSRYLYQETASSRHLCGAFWKIVLKQEELIKLRYPKV